MAARTLRERGCFLVLRPAAFSPFQQGLLELAKRYPVIDIRGRGLMCAVEFGGLDGGMSAPYGVAAAITKAAGKRNMLLLTAGAAFSLSVGLATTQLPSALLASSDGKRSSSVTAIEACFLCNTGSLGEHFVIFVRTPTGTCSTCRLADPVLPSLST